MSGSFRVHMKDILNRYPGLRVKGKSGDLYEMCGDLLFIGKDGRIERITSGVVWKCKGKGKKWFEFEIKKSVMIDRGISIEGQVL